MNNVEPDNTAVRFLLSLGVDITGKQIVGATLVLKPHELPYVSLQENTGSENIRQATCYYIYERCDGTFTVNRCRVCREHGAEHGKAYCTRCVNMTGPEFLEYVAKRFEDLERGRA